MFFIEFCFFLTPKAICAFGTADPDMLAVLELSSPKGSGFKATPVWFERQGLKNPKAKAFMAVFLNEPGFDLDRNMELKAAHKTIKLSSNRLSADGAKFGEKAKENALNHLLYGVAAGDLPQPSPDLAVALHGRMAGRNQMRGDFEYSAINIGSAMVVNGQDAGLVGGWHLACRESTSEPALLCVGPASAAPVELFLKSVPRSDLERFKPKYPVTSKDGFCGILPLGGSSPGPIFVVGLLKRPGRCHRVAIKAEVVEPVVMTTRIQKLQKLMGSVHASERLDTLVSTDGMTIGLQSEAIRPVGDSATTLLILVHDAPDTDLREILRICSARLPGPKILHVLRNSPSSKLRAALTGALRDAPEHWIEMLEPADNQDEVALTRGAEIVCFAQSSTLLQFDGVETALSDLRAKRVAASLILHDEMVNLSEAAPAKLDAVTNLVNPNFPLFAVFNGDVFREVNEKIPNGFASLDGRLRAVLCMLLKAELARFAFDRSLSFFQGEAEVPPEQAAELRRAAASDAPLLRKVGRTGAMLS